ncbi:ATP-dependent DNA helicase RecG [Conexibacter sp. DBS9H8]|uniref:ATP-dependent DNA helicase RecG n=1 Tax=Conexibacter sp. DBS9H8 TaxID=2937801 RepID=UPI00200DCDE5|nr:ATP-dependent DNA helicase RecG [Conexibacter sp. DBS9H8]
MTSLRRFTGDRACTAADLLAAPVRWPRPSALAAVVEFDGAKARAGARTLGLETVQSLLEHLPRDRREARQIAELEDGETASIVVVVGSIGTRPVRRPGMRPLVVARVSDPSGTLRVTFFNQPWLVQRYPPGTTLLLHGRFDAARGFTVQAHAVTDAVAGAGGGPASVAHYPSTDGLSSTQILALIQRYAVHVADVIDPLEPRVRCRERLLSRPDALMAVHFPIGPEDVDTGRRRLAFDELLAGQLTLSLARRARKHALRAPVLATERTLTERWLATGLPFTLTGEQRAALAAIDADIARPEPMQRLLMGDVGTGKTVVALYAMLRAVEHGCQAALMAPTETLAEQHFSTLERLLGAELLQAALLTGSTPGARRSEILNRLESGELALIVGTHALIEEAVRFRRLGVVVVDEQHRFGVAQRAALDRKGADLGAGAEAPHVLHMTATPIPRTLALSRYGDLDFTVLAELPRGRQPVQTRICASDAERSHAYARMRAELDRGRQAFVVCPLVEESEALEARAATAEFERLRHGELQGYEVVLLHGQMKPSVKAAAMERFGAGDADVLVATTVIEVGIDVPNATVMLVEDADRYGISQLHQLRGRIGRGTHASWCVLFGRRESLRLQALERESDGFALAEIDLALRGEGEIAGLRQSGAVSFRFARLPEDAELLERATLLARAIADADPALEAPPHRLLARAITGDPALGPIAPIPA